MVMHCDSHCELTPQTDLEFFWHMLGSLGNRDGYSLLEEAHEEEVDDACAAFMAGSEL